MSTDDLSARYNQLRSELEVVAGSVNELGADLEKAKTKAKTSSTVASAIALLETRFRSVAETGAGLLLVPEELSGRPKVRINRMNGAPTVVITSELDEVNVLPLTIEDLNVLAAALLLLSTE